MAYNLLLAAKLTTASSDLHQNDLIASLRSGICLNRGRDKKRQNTVQIGALNDTFEAGIADKHACPGKKRPQYSTHNFDKFRHSFVIFATNHPGTSVY